jgi:RND family efflux transporter MFP subunit
MKARNIYIATVFMVILSSCGGKDDLAAKKEQLSKLKEQAAELDSKINTLKNEISQLDTTAVAAASRNAVLVNLKDLTPKEFVHKIEVRGSVASRTNVRVSAETGGRITSVLVKEGDKVSKGQTLVTLDNEVLRNNINELKTSLELAEAVYERQANLWDKKIGTEIQYLEAKNQVESLQSRLRTANSQLSQSIVRAPFNGTIDEVPARVGEMAQPGMPLVQVVNQDNMYIDASVSERFIGDLKVGDQVSVRFPVIDTTLNSEIISISEVINEENRTFGIEVRLPRTNLTLKPNQVVVMEMVDYRNQSTLVVPTEVILSDAQGKYLFTAQRTDGEVRAQKNYISVGLTQDGMTEIKSGLTPKAELIVAGYREVNDGGLINPTNVSTETAKLN